MGKGTHPHRVQNNKSCKTEPLLWEQKKSVTETEAQCKVSYLQSHKSNISMYYIALCPFSIQKLSGLICMFEVGFSI